MKSRTRIATVAVALLSLLPAAGVAAYADSAAVATTNVPVNLDNNLTRTHEAPGIAVSPKDANRMVLGEVDLQAGRCLTHVSSDGGRTWSEAASPQGTAYVNCGPQDGNNYNTVASTALAYDSAGALYYAFAAAQKGDGDSRSIVVSRSTDNGGTWTTAVAYKAAPQAGDNADVNYQPTIAIDSDNSHVYVGFSRTFNFSTNKLDAGLIAASSDGGKTFSTPVDVGAPARSVGVAVLKGNVFGFFAEATPFPAPAAAKIYQAKSSDHGKTFSTKVINPGAKRIGSPGAAVDPASGTIAIAWYDNHLAKPDTVEDDVFVQTSTDGGSTWKSAVQVSPSKPTGTQNINQLLPAISQGGGRFEVAWYDYRNDPFPIPDKAKASYLGKVADVYGASSSDGGKTFSAAVRLTDHPIDRRIGTWNSQYFFVVPPAVASTGKRYYAAWSDTRNGNPDTQAQDIYLARADVAAPAAGTTSSSSNNAEVVLALEMLLAGAGLALIVAALLVRSRRPRPAGPDRTATSGS